MLNYKIIRLCILIYTPFLFSMEAHANIYKCVNNKSEVFYNDKPCPLNNKESEIRAVKDPVDGYIPPELNKVDKKSLSKSVVIGDQSLKNLSENKKAKSYTESLNNTNNDNQNSISNNKSETEINDNSASDFDSSNQQVTEDARMKPLGKLNVIKLEHVNQ